MLTKFDDNRGSFIVSDSRDCDLTFISVNTNKFTFRGLHFQTEPKQVKHISVIQGTILDIIYNLNTGVTEFYSLDTNSQPLVVGKDYAHGFLTLEDNTIVSYQALGQFNPNTYKSIPWHSIPTVHDRIQTIVGKNKITISDKDKYGNSN